MARARENDPGTELARLQGLLAQGDLARGYVLRGEERYFRERAVDLLKAKAESAGHELCVHEAGGGEFQLARLIDDLSGGGLFASRRLVVVRDAAALLKKTAGGENAFVPAARSFVSSAEDAGSLVLADASLRADNALVKAIAATGGVVLGFRKLYDSPPPWMPSADPRKVELVQWTERRSQELGLRLSTDQALYVAAATGNDLFALDDQLAMLRAGGGRALRDVVQWTAGGSPWNVADQILEGDLARALAGVEGLFRGGFQEKSGRRLVDPAGIANILIGALQRGIRSGIDLSQPGSGAEEGGNVMQKAALARARRRKPADWRRLLEEAATLERAAKSGVGVDANDFARLCLHWRLDRPTKRR